MKRFVLFISILLSSFAMALSASAATCNKTVASGVSIQNVVNGAVAGDVICVRGGTYHQTVSVSKSGTATSPITIQNYPGEVVVIDGQQNLPTSNWGSLVTINGNYVHMSGFEVKNTILGNNARGVGVYGHHNVISNFNVHHTEGNGILATGDYSIVENSRIWKACLDNAVNPGSRVWGSGLSVARDTVNGITDKAILRGNVVYDNWGEGLSSYEANGTLIENNITYNNWSVNLYISDSPNTIARNNLVYNANPNQASARPGSLTLADEVASKPRSSNVQITNNIVYGTSLCEACWTLVKGMSNINANHNTIVNGSLRIDTSNGTGIVQSANCTLTASQVPGLGTVTPGSLTPAKFTNASCPSGTGADVSKFGTSSSGGTTTPPPATTDPVSGNLEAEKYTSKTGGASIVTSSGIGASSGAYVGYTANGDVLVFNNIDLTGVTSLQTRVATAKTGSSLEVRTGSASGTLIGTVAIPSTGGWAGTNTWQTVTASITGASGAQNVYFILKGTTGGVADIDWLQFIQSVSANEAERYSSKTGTVGIITSSTVGASSGAYVGYTANGDVLVYNNIDLTGVTSLQTRVATAKTGSSIEVRTGSASGTLIGTVTIPSTGGWAGTNTWQTVTTAVSGATGAQNVYLVLKGTTGGIADIDWLKFAAGTVTTTTNLATNRPVTVSSTQPADGDGTYSASSAVDGNATTRWSSTFSDPQWISVDLGSAQQISRVVLNWEAGYGKSYNIQVSNDNVNWTTIYTTTTGNGATDDLTLSGTGRYVRMYGTARATAYGYSLWEMEVYGTPAVTAFPSTPTNLTATAVSSSQINLAWTASTNNTGYKIYRGGTQIATATTNSYSNTGLTAGTSYSYAVSSYDAAGNNSQQSTPASATTQVGTVSSNSLSLNRPVTVSSTQTTFSASYAVDGNTATRWSSTFSDPQWITVDLGSAQQISRVVLNWEAGYGKSYNIQVSNDNISWTTIYTTTTGNGGTDDLTGLSGSGRYVRMYGIARATAYGYSLYEMEVYGGSAPVVSGKFSLNDRVQVSNGPLNVRSAASTAGTLLGTQANGILGTVTAGPTAQGGYNWWNVNYDSGADGWSVEDYLVKYTPTIPDGTAETIWGTRTTTRFNYDNRAWELGTIFTPTVNGQVTRARVYGATNESGAHSVRLWRNSDGALLSGPHTFTYSGQGWQTFTFPSPIDLTANQSYTISVSTGGDTSKWYASIPADLTSGGSNGNHLAYPANAGVYTEVLGTRPIKIFNGENYLRDIMFIADTAAGTAPTTSGVTIEAERFSSKTGSLAAVTSSTVNASGGAYVGYTATGNVLVYNNVNLNNISSLQVRAATPLGTSYIEVRTGSAAGMVIGIVVIPNTGGWAGTNTWQTATAPISGGLGTQNVYLVLRGGTGGIADIDWLKFL